MKSISATSVNTYNMCPRWWYFNYRLHLLQLPNPAFIIGTAYHKCVELHKKKSNSEILNEIKKDVLLNSPPTKEEINAYGLIRVMFEKYCQYPIEGEVVYNEYKFNVPVPGIPVNLYGFVDRVDTDKIVEYKTSSYDYEQKDIETIQSKIYTYAIWKSQGKMLPVKYSIMNKTKAGKKDYKPQIMTIQYNEKDMKSLEQELIAFYNKIIHEKDFKYKQGTHCYFCPYGGKGTNNCDYGL